MACRAHWHYFVYIQPSGHASCLDMRCEKRIREIQLGAMWPQPVSDGKWFMFLDAGEEEESWQSPLSAITVARLRGNWNINSSFCNACKWLNGIILIIIISVVVGLLLSLSGEANIHRLSDTHPHIHIHTHTQLLHFFSLDCYHGSSIIGSHSCPLPYQ